ncbi:MAG TPA: PAS domain S-box protein, partial [Thermoanaerobaculia bacterium]|nr:PAS domain S-box protein [Thermoanaerobaculia bacterium]
MSAERAVEWSESDLGSRIDELVRILRAAERELQDLTGGQLDAVVGTADGALLLRSAQQRLRESEARQRELASTQVAIFDALPAHIALLDRAGVIVAVNEAWRCFGAANGLAGETFAVAESYLAVCDRAEGEGAGEAHSVSTGIRGVLAGSLPQFALEYPCHGPAEQRWFRLTVTPLDRSRPGGAVVMHVDITARRLAEEEIRRNQKLLKMASRLSRLGGWSYDVQEPRLTLSEELRSLLGVGEGELTVGQSIDQFVVPEQHEEIRHAFEDCVQHGRPYDVDLHMRTSEGREIWTRVIGEAERDAAGRIVRVQGAVQDVSEQLQAREAVRLSEERFRLLANATHDAIWDWGVAAARLWWNDGFVELLGYPQERAETITRRWTDLVHPDDRRRVVGDIVEAFDGDADHWSHECRLRRPDAEYVYVLHRGYAIRDDRGRLIRIVGGMTDLTERHKASERLAEQAALLDAANEAILVKDLDRRIVYWNKGAERIYGWTAEEAI